MRRVRIAVESYQFQLGFVPTNSSIRQDNESAWCNWYAPAVEVLYLSWSRWTQEQISTVCRRILLFIITSGGSPVKHKRCQWVGQAWRSHSCQQPWFCQKHSWNFRAFTAARRLPICELLESSVQNKTIRDSLFDKVSEWSIKWRFQQQFCQSSQPRLNSEEENKVITTDCDQAPCNKLSIQKRRRRRL